MEHRNYKDIYIGKLIQQKLDESHICYAKFARQIHCSRSNLYKIFECKSIDVERLLLISEILHYDFIHEVYLPQDTLPLAVDKPYVLLPLKEGKLSLDDLPLSLRSQLEHGQ